MQTRLSNYPIINLANLYKNGLVPYLTAGSLTKLYVAPGACRDSTNSMDIIVGAPDIEGNTVAAPLIVDLTVAGAGGVDVLPVTINKMYYLYIIADSRFIKPTAALVSLKSTNKGEYPLLPRGYDSIRLIAAWPVDGSGVFINGAYAGINSHLVFAYDGTYQVLNGGNATTYTNVTLDSFVPVGANLTANFLSIFSIATVTDSAGIKIPGFTQANVLLSPSSTTSPSYQQISTITQYNGANQVVQYKVSAGGDSLSLYVSGFELDV